MKIFNLTLFFIVTLSTFSYSQFQKGTWTINPGSGTVFIRAGGTSAFASATEFGYFLSKNSLIGFELQYARVGDDSETSPNPYFRYYFTPDKAIKLYGQINSGLTITNQYAVKQTLFAPKLNFGFNHLLQKNIALELGFDINSYSFIKQEYLGTNVSESSMNFSVSPELGMRLFINTENSESRIYMPTDYLRSGNFTFGTYGNLVSNPKNDFLSYNFLLNFDFFLNDFLSIGTSIQLSPSSTYTGYDNEVVAVFAPSIQSYFPISPDDGTQLVPYVGVEINPFDEYIGYNIGLKLNRFIGENVSLWGGPFVLRIRDVDRWFFNARVGVNYFLMSKKNRRS